MLNSEAKTLQEIAVSDKFYPFHAISMDMTYSYSPTQRYLLNTFSYKQCTAHI